MRVYVQTCFAYCITLLSGSSLSEHVVWCFEALVFMSFLILIYVVRVPPFEVMTMVRVEAGHHDGYAVVCKLFVCHHWT